MATVIPNIDEILKEIIEEADDPRPERSWQVILYNDNHNKFDDVVLWIQKATGCSHEVASHVTHEAHTKGRAVCYEGEKQKCHKVAGLLRRHGLQVEVDSR